MDIINGSPLGNASSIFTRDGGAARRFQLEVETGMVGVNVPMPVPVGYHFLGGWKDSAFGDHRMYGSEAIHFYTRGKVITSRWPDPAEVAAGPDLGLHVPLTVPGPHARPRGLPWGPGAAAAVLARRGRARHVPVPDRAADSGADRARRGRRGRSGRRPGRGRDLRATSPRGPVPNS